MQATYQYIPFTKIRFYIDTNAENSIMKAVMIPYVEKV